MGDGGAASFDPGGWVWSGVPQALAIVEEGVLQGHVRQLEVRVVDVPHQRAVPDHDLVLGLHGKEREVGGGGGVQGEPRRRGQAKQRPVRWA